jgi:uncharacterized damage-inducible protein DinB
MRKVHGRRFFAICTFLALPLAAAEYNWKANQLKHWPSSYEFTLTVANAMPESGYSYIPPSTAKPVERTYAGLMIHIGVFNDGMMKLVTGMDGPTPPPPTSTDKAAVIQFLKDSQQFVMKALNAVTEEQLNKTVKFGGIEETGREAIEGAFAHMAHTRGQCEVYLRLQNILPPKYPFE